MLSASFRFVYVMLQKHSIVLYATCVYLAYACECLEELEWLYLGPEFVLMGTASLYTCVLQEGHKSLAGPATFQEPVLVDRMRSVALFVTAG